MYGSWWVINSLRFKRVVLQLCPGHNKLTQKKGREKRKDTMEMSLLQLPSTLSLQGNLTENWRTWIQKFELFCTAAEQTEKVQCATFLHVAGEEAIQVWNTFVFHDDEKDKIEVLKKKFQDYCEPRRTLPRLRHMFFTRAQGPTETIDAYVTDLEKQGK